MKINNFCKWWSVRNTLPPNIDLICLVSFGATGDDLSNGLKKVVKEGVRLQGIYPDARVVFGEFTKNPITGIETALKLVSFPKALVAGQVISTIEEAEKWRAVCGNFKPQNGIVIVTDEMHSRSARRVSNRVWNGWWFARLWKRIASQPIIPVFVATFPTRDGIDAANPMVALRNQKLWVRNNVLREAFLVFVPFGYSIMKKLNIHQPVA